MIVHPVNGGGIPQCIMHYTRKVSLYSKTPQNEYTFRELFTDTEQKRKTINIYLTYIGVK